MKNVFSLILLILFINFGYSQTINTHNLFITIDNNDGSADGSDQTWFANNLPNLKIASVALEYTWTGGGDILNWDDPNNWDSGVTPTSITNCIIPWHVPQPDLALPGTYNCANLTINPKSIFSLQNGVTLNVNGNLSASGNITTNDVSKLYVTGTADFSVLTINVESEIEIDGATTFKLGSPELNILEGTFDANGSFDATGIEINFIGAGNISISGDPSSLGNLTSDAGTITFDGNSLQTLSEPETYNNVIFNNSTSGTAISLSEDITINGTITLTDGIITTGSNKIIATSTNASDLPIGSSSAFVNGNIRKSIATNTQTYTFPVGKGNTTNDYSPAELTNSNLVGPTWLDVSFGEIIEETFNNNDARITTTHNGGGFINLHEDAVWTITPDAQPTSGSYDLKLNIAIVSGLEDNKFTILSRPDASTDYADWATYDGSTSIPNNGQLGRTVSGGYAIKYGFTTFSQKAPASGSDPLPIELINFSALQNGAHVDLAWTTESEINNDYYSIERSINGNTFETILKAEGAGTSNERVEYRTKDNNPLEGISYYRLKQTDFDGKLSYSKIIAINRANNKKISIWPNPASNKIYLPIDVSQNIDYQSHYEITIKNAKGQLVYSEDFTATSNVKVIDISNLDSGVYYLRQASKSGVSNARFIK